MRSKDPLDTAAQTLLPKQVLTSACPLALAGARVTAQWT